jgi:nitrate reductase assembly molybdenum cofactor insertion protein NarJ
MRQHMRRFDVPEDTELPDHITHVLAVLGRMESEEANNFAVKSVLPALEKMLAGLEGKDSLYENVLGALQSVLTDRHARVAEEVNHE